MLAWNPGEGTRFQVHPQCGGPVTCAQDAGEQTIICLVYAYTGQNFKVHSDLYTAPFVGSGLGRVPWWYGARPHGV